MTTIDFTATLWRGSNQETKVTLQVQGSDIRALVDVQKAVEAAVNEVAKT